MHDKESDASLYLIEQSRHTVELRQLVQLFMRLEHSRQEVLDK